MTDLNMLTATQAGALIAGKHVSSVELTRACLARIRERDGDVGAWCHLDEDFALAQAARADRSEPLSPLHGVPFGVKDIIDTRDFPTEWGSPIHAGRRCADDAPCVAQLRAAGAVLLGKTVTTEYALFTPGKTRHPMNLAHTPGGSSSGTAAAVADLQVPIAFGSQTAGSLLRPAAFCGVFGLKPTYGATDLAGVMPLVPFFDTVGYMARSLDDLQAFFGLASRAPAAGTRRWREPRPPRIGLCRTAQWDQATPATRFVLEQAALQLAAQGVEIVDFRLPASHDDLPEVHRVISWKVMSETLGADCAASRGRMSDRLVGLLEAGRDIPVHDYAQQLAFAMAARASVNSLIGRLDALLAPCAPGEAPEGLATGDPVFQLPWTVLGVPVLNLPLGSGPMQLPIGVQLVGKRHEDARLLAIAHHLMDRLTPIRMAA